MPAIYLISGFKLDDVQFHRRNQEVEEQLMIDDSSMSARLHFPSSV